jgi:hypothetical protein
MRILTAQGVCGDFHGRILEAQTQAIHEKNYRIAINKDFMPVFGERSLHDVKKKDIKAFIYALQGGGAFPAHDTDIRQSSQRIDFLTKDW